jgi:hypothetical protein
MPAKQSSQIITKQKLTITHSPIEKTYCGNLCASRSPVPRDCVKRDSTKNRDSARRNPAFSGLASTLRTNADFLPNGIRFRPSRSDRRAAGDANRTTWIICAGPAPRVRLRSDEIRMPDAGWYLTSSCLQTPASRLLPPDSCLRSPASGLLPPVSCLRSPVSCLLPPASCLLPPDSRLQTPVSCLRSPISRRNGGPLHCGFDHFSVAAPDEPRR